MAAAEKFKQQSEPVAQKPAVPKIEEDEEDEGEVPTFNKVRNLTQNDPFFDIWPQISQI